MEIWKSASTGRLAKGNSRPAKLLTDCAASQDGRRCRCVPRPHCGGGRGSGRPRPPTQVTSPGGGGARGVWRTRRLGGWSAGTSARRPARPPRLRHCPVAQTRPRVLRGWTGGESGRLGGRLRGPTAAPGGGGQPRATGARSWRRRALGDAPEDSPIQGRGHLAPRSAPLLWPSGRETK